MIVIDIFFMAVVFLFAVAFLFFGIDAIRYGEHRKKDRKLNLFQLIHLIVAGFLLSGAFVFLLFD